MRFGVQHRVKRFHWRCSNWELHLKWSLAMLIRGWKHPLLHVPWGIQHEHVARNFYRVFVPSVPCCFILSFVSQVASRQVCCTIKLWNSFVHFVRMLLWRLMLQFLAVDSAYLFASMANSCHHIQDGSQEGSQPQPRGWRRASSFPSSSVWGMESDYAGNQSEHSDAHANDAELPSQ